MVGEREIPATARIVRRTDESETVFTLALELVDQRRQSEYRFEPGQFNMLYLFAGGEIPVSISSDPDRPGLLQHTIRQVGRITHAMAGLQAGDMLGLRGPFGRGWPLDRAGGRNVLIITGGLGCAPVQPVIKQMMRNRADYAKVAILQGVKHSDDLIWKERYQKWARTEDTQVLLAADVAGAGWPWQTGQITTLLDQVRFDFNDCITMMCGPEPMMAACTRYLLDRDTDPETIWLSMERNMQCAIGHCGHCQYGEKFICRDGPVFPCHEIAHLLGVRGI